MEKYIVILYQAPIELNSKKKKKFEKKALKTKQKCEMN